MASDEEKAVDEGLWDVVTNLQNDLGFDNLVFNAVIEALRDTYTQGRADAWRWIPVSERLPEEDHQVLALCGPGFYYLVTREGSTWWSGATVLKENRRPTHWMPLPPSKHLPTEAK